MASNPDLKVVAFVHAKGTSERLPGKNLQVLGDRPLVCHAIANALAAEMVDAVVIDSDSDEILCVGEEAGAVPLKRKPSLAGNAATGDDLARWQAENLPSPTYVMLQVVPTSPFVSPRSIDRAIHMLNEYRLDSVVGVRSEVFYKWRKNKPDYIVDDRIPNTQDMAETTYETTGLYAVRCSYATVRRRRINPDSCRLLELSKIEAIDINTLEDFAFAEIVWKGMHC